MHSRNGGGAGKSINIGGHENVLLGQEENNTDVSENPQAVICSFGLSIELLGQEQYIDLICLELWLRPRGPPQSLGDCAVID